MTSYSYEVACLDREKRVTIDRVKKVLGCGTFPLDRANARAGAIACPHCRAEWPEVKLTTHHPEGAEVPKSVPETASFAPLTPPVSEPPRTPAQEAQVSAEDIQGDLFLQ